MPELPTTFGKYFLTEKLATGGMAEIYLAKIVGPGGFEKQLVIKQIHPKLSGQRHFVDLFVAEAKTLVSLTHGNIVPVYELGVVDDTYFIAMEYIDGPTLYRLTESLARKDARMDPAVAAWITARIVEGLDYAHRKGDGVIHRDLSPRNVMLSRDGEVKLVDFGIAVTLGDANDDESAQSAPTGSFPYMSPEQVRKQQLTNQTDVFSVGVLAWEMLVGHRLFARNDPEATLRAVTESDIPRPSAERPDIPSKLDDIVLRALERDTAARWANASEMLAALNKYLYALDATPGPREVAALVARYCPPETRRLPTHADPPVPVGDTPSGDGAGVDATLPAPAPPVGPHTAVIPRKRPGTTRNQSFATHVQLKDILERGTPLFPFDAIDDKDTARDPAAPASAPTLDSGPVTTARASESGTRTRAARSDDSLVGPGGTQQLRPGDRTEPPGRGVLVVAGLGGFVLLAIAIWMFMRTREQVLAIDAAPAPDVLPFYMHDADLRTDAIDDAPALADAAVDAAPVDADRPAVRDAIAAADATTKPDAVVPAGKATLVIGAIPWGEVYVDGVKQAKTAPGEFVVPSGKHTIEVVFPEADPPKKQTFKVDVAPDERIERQVDFSK